MRHIAVAILVLTLSGCASLRDEVQPWMGRNKSELIEAWGPPVGVRSDGQGGTILHYSRAGGRYTAQILMYAHKNGILYYWRTRERS